MKWKVEIRPQLYYSSYLLRISTFPFLFVLNFFRVLGQVHQHEIPSKPGQPYFSPYEQMINEQKKQGAGIFFSLNIGS